MKQYVNEEKGLDFPSSLNKKDIYWTFFGQLCFFEKQRASIIKILSFTENSLGLYFSTMAEYIELRSEAINNYNDTLNRMSEINPPAYAYRKSECVRCGMCCWTWPCCVKEDEISRIADYLGFSEDKFIENYTVLINGIRTMRRHEWEDISGSTLVSYRVYDIKTPCVFYDDSSKICKIHTVKPDEGKDCKCWEDEAYLIGRMEGLRKKYNEKINSLISTFRPNTL